MCRTSLRLKVPVVTLCTNVCTVCATLQFKGFAGHEPSWGDTVNGYCVQCNNVAVTISRHSARHINNTSEVFINANIATMSLRIAPTEMRRTETIYRTATVLSRV
jgi:hypothetical protein